MRKIIFTEDDLKRLKELANCKRPVKSMLGYVDGLFNQVSRYTSPEKAKVSKRKVSVAESANYYRGLLVDNQTESEKVFKALLKSCGVEYEFQKIFYCGNGFSIVDFYVPSKEVVFEIDGGYHDKPIQKVKDMKRTNTLVGTCKVKKVVRLKNSDILDTDVCIGRINKELEI